MIRRIPELCGVHWQVNRCCGGWGVAGETAGKDSECSSPTPRPGRHRPQTARFEQTAPGEQLIRRTKDTDLPGAQVLRCRTCTPGPEPEGTPCWVNCLGTA